MADKLRELVKLSLRVTSGAFDDEVDALIAAARADLVRAGVSEERLGTGAEAPDPLAAQAIILYCKASFGFDNPDADRLARAYDSLVVLLANSPTLYGDRP